MTTETTTCDIIDIYTSETVGAIEMTDEQTAQYIADCGDTGAITAERLADYGDIDELSCDADATVYVQQ